MKAAAEKLIAAAMQSDHTVCREFKEKVISGEPQVAELYGKLHRQPEPRRPGDPHLTYPPEFKDPAPGAPGWGSAKEFDDPEVSQLAARVGH